MKFLIKKRDIHFIPFTLLLAVYFTFAINIPLAALLKNILEKLPAFELGFAFSLPLFFIGCFFIFFSLFTFKYIEKPFFMALVMISALLSYASFHYGVIFDEDMIANIVQTNVGESTSYFNLSFVMWFFFFGVIPAFMIHRLSIKRPRFLKSMSYRLISIASCAFLFFIIGVFYYEDYVTVGRNNRQINKEIIPMYFVYSGYKYIREHYIKTPMAYQFIGMDAKQKPLAGNGKNNLLVLVVGETARSMNYELNGYERPTNRFTKELGVLSYQHVTSCGTATAVSLPCMFSNMTRQEYSGEKAKHSDNLLDILARAKLNVLWLDNDGGCKGACDRISNVMIPTSKNQHCDGLSCFDSVMLDGLQDRINERKGKDSVIVLHIIGSHGPTYYKRYPDEHRQFVPDCKRSDIQNCTHDELVNTYDNTILYTDFIISQVVDLLKKNESDWNSGMIYMSDHGESLGEHGLYLHGFPYSLAPKEQTHVPMITWFSEGFHQTKNLDKACMKQNALNETYSHDNYFHSILGLMDVETNAYDNKLDLFQGCRRADA